MNKPTTDAAVVDSVASTDYSQGFYDGYAEGSNKALAAAIAGDKLGIAFMVAVRFMAAQLPVEEGDIVGEHITTHVIPALDEWDRLRDQITEG